MAEDNKPEETPPPPPPSHAEHTVDAQIRELSTKVDELTALVQSVVDKGQPDSTPVRQPWTHWGSRK